MLLELVHYWGYSSVKAVKNRCTTPYGPMRKCCTSKQGPTCTDLSGQTNYLHQTSKWTEIKIWYSSWFILANRLSSSRKHPECQSCQDYWPRTDPCGKWTDTQETRTPLHTDPHHVVQKHQKWYILHTTLNNATRIIATTSHPYVWLFIGTCFSRRPFKTFQ